MTVPDPPEPCAFSAVEARLIARFSPALDPDEVHRHFIETVTMFEDARVQTYLAVLIERAATARLRAACEIRTEPAPAVRPSDVWDLPASVPATPTPEVSVILIDRAVPVGGA